MQNIEDVVCIIDDIKGKHQSSNKVARSKAARSHALLDGRMASATAFRGTVALLVDSVIPRGGGMEEGYVASMRGSKCSGIKASSWKHAAASSRHLRNSRRWQGRFL